MNRREFLKTAVAASLTAAFPAIPHLEALPFDAAATFTTLAQKRGDWLFFVHPTVEQDVRNIAARDEWKWAWRAAREAGEQDLSPRQVLAEYGAKPHAMNVSGGLGSVESFRFIVSPEIA